MDTIKVYIFKQDGIGKAHEIDNDYFGFLRAMGITEDDYFSIHQIFINDKKYDLYVIEYIDMKKNPKITAMYKNRERCFIGDLLITRHDKNQELISLIDKDIENITNAITCKQISRKQINGEYYSVSDKVIML